MIQVSVRFAVTAGGSKPAFSPLGCVGPAIYLCFQTITEEVVGHVPLPLCTFMGISAGWSILSRNSKNISWRTCAYLISSAPIVGPSPGMRVMLSVLGRLRLSLICDAVVSGFVPGKSLSFTCSTELPSFVSLNLEASLWCSSSFMMLLYLKVTASTVTEFLR